MPADCPPGYQCQVSEHLCKTGPLDTVPPGLASSSVTYLPAPMSPIAQPAALGSGAVAQLTFEPTEAIQQPQLVTCSQLSCAGPTVTGLTFSYSCTAAAGVVTACDVHVQLKDLAGNPADAALPLVLIDTAPPLPPPVDVPNVVRFMRVPWGAASTDGGAALWVELSADAGEPGAQVIIYGTATGLELGRAPLDALGAGRVDVPTPDRGEVWAQAADRAGNASATVRVRDVSWLATLGGKLPGDFVSNPNSFDVRTVFNDVAVRKDALERGADDGIAELGAGRITTQSATTWVQRFTDAPQAVFGSAYAYDSARGRIVLFGGDGADQSHYGDTWEWTSRDWVPIQLSDPQGDGNPPLLTGAAMAYDSLHRRCVLFGGDSIGALRSDTWLYDGQSWQLASTPTHPSARRQHAVAYDRAHGQLVLFGGDDGSQLLDDTWLFDGVRWQQMSPAQKPSARKGHRMIWDPTQGRILLFAGEAAGGVLNDLWQWDGTAWTQVTVPSAPPPRTLAGFTFDPNFSALYVYGGLGDDGGARKDVWLFDGGWAPYTAPPNPPPGPRAAGMVIYDTRGGNTLVMGGTTADGGRDTYAYNTPLVGGRTWSIEHSPQPGPGVRTNHAMAYNPDTGTVVLAGGTTDVVVATDTFAWNGRFWKKGASLPADDGHSLAFFEYDREGKQMIFFGGWPNSDAGTLAAPGDGTTTASYVRIAAGPPSSRGLVGHAYDPATGGLLMLGGSDIYNDEPVFGLTKETWLWKGGQWQPSSPLPFVEAGLGFSVITTADGGYGDGIGTRGSLSGTGVDGMLYHRSADGGWTQQLYSGEMPPRLLRAQTVFDPDRNRVLLYSGPPNAGDPYTSDRLWEWDGTQWSQLNIADAEGFGTPGARTGYAMAFSEKRRVLDLYGGSRADLWEWLGSVTTPGHVFHIVPTAARAPADATPLSLTVKAVAGGDGVTLGGHVSGAMLYVFIQGWHRLTANAADAGAPAWVSAAVTGSELDELLHSEPEILVGLSPLGFSFASPSVLTTDYLEAQLDYRLPP